MLMPKDGPGLKKVVAEAARPEGSPMHIERLRTLATGQGGEPVSYFDAFRSSSLS